jgi:DNA-binding CsgD family transcriptional regulator
MDGRKSLDYLLLSPDERINYRVERGISLKEWYGSLAPEPFEGEVKRKDLCRLLGISPEKFYTLDKKGYFGKTRLKANRRLIKSERANEILRKQAYLVPVSLLYKAEKRERWYMSRVKFDIRYRKLYESVAGKKQRFVTVVNAARIIHEGRARHAMIEEWPTLHDLNRESGLNLSPEAFLYRYRRLRKQGRVKLASVNVYGGRPIKGFGGREYKLAPHEYRRMLAIEKKQAKALMIGLTAPEIAKRMGISLPNVEAYIKIGRELGLLHPHDLIGHSAGGYGRFVLWPGEAELLVNGELNVPSAPRYSNLRKGRSVAEVRKLLMEEAKGGFTTIEIAGQMGIDRGTVSGMIRSGQKLGMIHPRSIVPEGSIRPFRYLIPPEEARLMISRELYIPCEKAAERMARRASLLSSQAAVSIDDICEEDEQRLIEMTRLGDHASFNVLLEAYELFISRLAGRYFYGTSVLERRDFFCTAMYEAIMERKGNLPRSLLIHLMRKKVRKRMWREISSWRSLSKKIRRTNELTFLDVLDTEGKIRL